MLLKASNLGYRYGHDDWLFRHLNLTLRQGDIVGLVGPSGSGKTSLARILAGFEQPNEGRVDVGHSAKHIQSQHYPVQLVFQHPEKAVNPRWRVRAILQESWQPDNALLQAIGIEQQWLDRWPNELSGGELQRICIARALSPQTQFLIADEMTTMLDAITQAQIWHAVLDIARQRQLGLLIISHEQKLIERLCSRVIHLN